MIESVKRLNFGCGYIKPENWTNVDKLDYDGNIVADVLEGMPFPDEYFDYILSNHSIQMITFDDLPQAFVELRRILKIGGTLRILVPDFEWALHIRQNHQTSQLPIADYIEPTEDAKFLRYVFWHGDARSAFTAKSLIDTLNRNGFQSVRKCEFEQTYSNYPDITSLDSREAESLIIEGVK